MQLVSYDEMRGRLAVINTPQEARTVESQAQKLRDLYILSNDTIAANEYAEIALEAARSCGEMLGVDVKQGERTDLTSQRGGKLEIPGVSSYRRKRSTPNARL